MNKKEINNSLIGKKMIKTAINLDEALVEILKIEVKRIKNLAKSGTNLEELQRTNILIKNIIIALTITDEKIKTGIDFLYTDSKNEHN